MFGRKHECAANIFGVERQAIRNATHALIVTRFVWNTDCVALMARMGGRSTLVRSRFSNSGEYLGYISAVIDITTRKVAEQALQEEVHRGCRRRRMRFDPAGEHRNKPPLQKTDPRRSAASA